MWSGECCCVAFLRANQMASFWRPNMFPFCEQSVSYHNVLKIYFAIFTSKRKRNTLKGSVKGSLGKKQFVQQWEMPKKAISGKWANHIASCVQAKHRSEILWWPCFPCAEKIPTQLCPDSPCGPRCSEHTGQEFHLPRQGWNWISCDYKLWCWLGWCWKRVVQWYDV